MSYSGLPTTESLSPYKGMFQLLKDQIAGQRGTYDFNSLIEHIAKSIGDYDSAKQLPVAGPFRLRTPEEKEGPEPVLKRLEDIDATWLENYIRSGIIGYKKRPDGLSSYLHRTKEAIVFQNSDGDFLTGADLERDRDNTTDLDVFAAKEKLPYLLKRIHFKSKQLGVSLISMYGVFLMVNGSVDTKPREMLKHTIWKMDKFGNVTTPYPQSANQNPGFGENFQYIKGFRPDEYYQDLLEFREVLDILGIRLWEEDPREFDEAFISRLIVKYVVPNNVFLWKGQRKDSTVLNALGSMSVSDWGFNHSTSDAARIRSFVMNFCDSRSPIVREYMLPDHEGKKNIDYFLFLYARATKDKNFYTGEDGKPYPQTRHMDTYEWFYCLPDEGSPYAFDVTPISNIPGAVALLHNSGHLIMVSNTKRFQAITVSEAIAAFATYNRNQGVGGKVEWTPLVM